MVRAFGKSNLFMDVYVLLAGQRFDKELEKTLSQCDVLIAVIGWHWMELLPSRGQSSDRGPVAKVLASVRDAVVELKLALDRTTVK